MILSDTFGLIVVVAVDAVWKKHKELCLKKR